MKTILGLALMLSFGTATVAQDCENGVCRRPAAAQVAKDVKAVASSPVKVVKQVRAKKPVRSFLKKVFGR